MLPVHGLHRHITAAHHPLSFVGHGLRDLKAEHNMMNLPSLMELYKVTNIAGTTKTGPGGTIAINPSSGQEVVVQHLITGKSGTISIKPSSGGKVTLDTLEVGENGNALIEAGANSIIVIKKIVTNKNSVVQLKTHNGGKI